MIFDAHSCSTTKISGFEVFALSLLEQSSDRQKFQCFFSGRLARILNFLLPFIFRTQKIVFITNPPLFWTDQTIRRSIFVVHDIYPVLSKTNVQVITKLVYGRFLKACLAKGRVVSVSEYTANQIYKCFDMEVAVIGNIVRDLRPLKPKRPFENRDSFYLAVGTIEPRKNYSYMISEFADYRSQGGKVPFLVIVGRRGWLSNTTIDEIQKHPNVVWLDQASDENLAWLYRNTFLLLSSSTHEGFNMPPFEASYLGRPALVPKESAPAIEYPGFYTFDIVPGELNHKLFSIEDAVSNNDAMPMYLLERYSPESVLSSIHKLEKVSVE